ncbi:unnamed protein product [Musa acuminata var. zebrina]
MTISSSHTTVIGYRNLFSFGFLPRILFSSPFPSAAVRSRIDLFYRILIYEEHVESAGKLMASGNSIQRYMETEPTLLIPPSCGVGPQLEQPQHPQEIVGICRTDRSAIQNP